MTGWGGVKHDRLPLGLRGEVNELVERRHLFGTGRIEFFSHDLEGGCGPATLPGIVEDALLVDLGGRFRIDLRGPQVGQAFDRRGVIADWFTQHIADVRGRVRGKQQCLVALSRQPDRRDARRDRLAYAALTREEHGAAVTVRRHACQNIGR